MVVWVLPQSEGRDPAGPVKHHTANPLRASSQRGCKVSTSLRCAVFRSCLGRHVQLGHFLGGSRGLVRLSQELHGHCEDRLVHWTRLSYESEFQTGSVLVQTHHSIHVEIISDCKDGDPVIKKGQFFLTQNLECHFSTKNQQMVFTVER